MVDEEPEVTPLVANTPIGASVGAIGVGPYGDFSEHTGPPEVIVYTPPHRPFFDTDARSVLITLLPQHYNLIPNPAFRTSGAGWIATGLSPALNSFAWRVANTSAAAGLNAITGNTASPTLVDPDPAVAADYVDGQIVKVVDTLATDVTVAWLKIDNVATLSVAQAAAVGITIAAPVPKYRVYDPFADAMSADSWVGRSVTAYGTGMLRYREATDKFVYVGPLRDTQSLQWDVKRGGPEYSFSVFVKGEGDVRLTMDSYLPIDRSDLTSGPEYQNLTSVASPQTYVPGPPAILETGTGRVWTAITYPAVPTIAPYYEDLGRGPALATAATEWIPTKDDGDWHRVSVKTKARVYEHEGQVSFLGCRWIDTKIEIRSANNLRVSAVMLDPVEYPLCDYFDGGMAENLYLDDFIWEGAQDASVSYYYFDRVVRTKWLYERIGYVVPAGRPVQIFFASYWRPYVGKTGQTVVMVPPP